MSGFPPSQAPIGQLAGAPRQRPDLVSTIASFEDELGRLSRIREGLSELEHHLGCGDPRVETAGKSPPSAMPTIVEALQEKQLSLRYLLSNIEQSIERIADVIGVRHLAQHNR